MPGGVNCSERAHGPKTSATDAGAAMEARLDLGFQKTPGQLQNPLAASIGKVHVLFDACLVLDAPEKLGTRMHAKF